MTILRQTFSLSRVSFETTIEPMERTLIKDAAKKVGEKVRISGSVHVVRSHGKIVFADIYDRTGILQVVGGQDISELKPQYAVEVEGTINLRPEKMANEKIETGKVELALKKLKILESQKKCLLTWGRRILILSFLHFLIFDL